MIIFDQFAITPGIVLNGRVARGQIHVLTLEANDWQDAFVDSYLADLSGGSEDGDVLLEEVRDANGKPQRLCDVPSEIVRGYFARFVGFVPRDGGLIDALSIRENLMLAFHYAEIWPRRAPVTHQEVSTRLDALLAFPGAPDLATWLDLNPASLTQADRRLVGLVRALVRHPDLVVVFAPFAGLTVSARRRWWDCLQHFRAAHPQSAHLLVLNQRDEVTGLPGASDVVELTPNFSSSLP